MRRLKLPTREFVNSQNLFDMWTDGILCYYYAASWNPKQDGEVTPAIADN